MNKGCGKFKWNVSIVGGWCGITEYFFGKDKHYCKQCIKKFVKNYKKFVKDNTNENHSPQTTDGYVDSVETGRPSSEETFEDALCECGHYPADHDRFENQCQGEDWDNEKGYYINCKCKKLVSRGKDVQEEEK